MAETQRSLRRPAATDSNGSNSRMKTHGFHNPNKHRLELLTQAAQDAIENGHETHASGFDYVAGGRMQPTDEWDGNDLDTPFLPRDRRFIIKIPQ